MGDNGLGVNCASRKRQNVIADDLCFVFFYFFELVSLSNVSLHWFHLKEDSWRPTKKEDSPFWRPPTHEVVYAGDG